MQKTEVGFNTLDTVLFNGKSVNTSAKLELTMWHINISGPATKPSQKIQENLYLKAAEEALNASMVDNMNLPMTMRKQEQLSFQNQLFKNWHVHQQ